MKTGPKVLIKCQVTLSLTPFLPLLPFRDTARNPPFTPPNECYVEWTLKTSGQSDSTCRIAKNTSLSHSQKNSYRLRKTHFLTIRNTSLNNSQKFLKDLEKHIFKQP
jgi:hypothetical protein